MYTPKLVTVCPLKQITFNKRYFLVSMQQTPLDHSINSLKVQQCFIVSLVLENCIYSHALIDSGALPVLICWLVVVFFFHFF